MSGGPGGTARSHTEQVGLRVEHVGHPRLGGAHRHGGVGGGEGRAGAAPPESREFSFRGKRRGNVHYFFCICSFLTDLKNKNVLG